MDRIRGTLQASKVGQPMEGGQQPLLPLAEVKEVPAKQGTEAQGKGEVPGKKGNIVPFLYTTGPRDDSSC